MSRPYNNQQKREIYIIQFCKFLFFVDYFAIVTDHRIKLKESQKKDNYTDLARELKKTMEHKGDNYTNCEWCFWHSN